MRGLMVRAVGPSRITCNAAEHDAAERDTSLTVVSEFSSWNAVGFHVTTKSTWHVGPLQSATLAASVATPSHRSIGSRAS